MAMFPVPATAKAACGFPALRFPVNFATKGDATYRPGGAFGYVGETRAVGTDKQQTRQSTTVNTGFATAH
jgi:hypothetical protein